VHDKDEARVPKVSAGAGSIDGSTGDRFGAMCNNKIVQRGKYRPSTNCCAFFSNAPPFWQVLVLRSPETNFKGMQGELEERHFLDAFRR
jgi:hypothetical protein